ncbi:MAG: hypothetical protein IJT59_02945 [Desulfovibrionaceae bacterium]|nr:hypothetical protein [Desulfovibrionaceae bacterium]
MENPYIKCKECWYTEKLSTTFLFQYCRQEIFELAFKAFPGSFIGMIVAIFFPTSHIGEQFINVINKKYACPKCGKRMWITLTKG